MERERRNQPLGTARDDAGSEEMDGPHASQIWLMGERLFSYSAGEKVGKDHDIFAEASIPRLKPLIRRDLLPIQGCTESRQPGKRHTLTAVTYRFGPVVKATRVPSSESDRFVTVSPVRRIS